MNGTIILLIIVVYFAFLMLISHLTGRKSDNDTFFLGGKQSPWFLVAFGMIGTSISGVTFVSDSRYAVEYRHDLFADRFGVYGRISRYCKDIVAALL